MKYLIYILFALGSYISVTHWLNNFNISPDSANYITASENLVKHSSLFVYSNWPSHSFEPQAEPYTEYMPGLPVITSIGFLFTSNPDTVMLIMNSLFIVLLYFMVYLLLTELQFNNYLKIIFLLFLTFFEPFRMIFSTFWTETLFILFSLLSAFFSVKLLKADDKKYWLLGCCAVAFSAFIKMYGVFNCAFFIVPFILHKKKVTHLVSFVFCCSLFVIAWYIRNEITYGYFTYSHKMFEQFNKSNVLRPFKWTLYLLGNNTIANLYGIALVLIASTPAILYIRKKIVMDFDFKIWMVLICGCVINFSAIYILSLVSKFDYLESRLLSPVYILCFLIFFISIKILGKRKYFPKAGYALPTLTLFFFMVNPAFTKSVYIGIKINFPAEHNLWDEIRQKGIAKNSSHYITDFNFIHEIYGGMAQRIIVQDFMFLNIGFLSDITNKGMAPFVVLRNNELPYFYFEKIYRTLNYKKAGLQDKNFTVYVKND